MAITQTDINNMESKLVELASKGVVEYELDGFRVRFTNLGELRRAIAEAKSILAGNTVGNCFRARFNEASD